MAHNSELRESQIMPAPSQAETTVISSLRIPKIKNTSQMSNSSSSSLVLTKQELQELIDKRETLHKQILRLHSILERTSKALGDITRKHDGREWRDQTYKDNMRLQQDTEKRVHELREEMSEIDKKIALAKEPEPMPEESNEAATSSPTSTSMLEEENQYDASEVFSTSAPRYEFFDPGSHWCSQCNEIHSDLDAYLKHLHSKSHSGKIDPSEQAWISKKFCKPKPKVSPDQPCETIQIKGTQFILPIKGYFCKICEVFMANVAHAEDHLKTKDHDRLYNRYVLVNQNYEQKYGVDKARAMNKILNEKKRKREQEEREERERENKKRQQEAEQRRRERILREKAEEENRLKAKAQREARESAERDREREKEKKKLLRAKERLVEKDRKERKSKAIIDSSDESDDSSVDSSKFKPREKVKTEPPTNTVPDKDDKKLSMKLIVDIPKSEWQLCYNKHMRRVLRRKNSNKTEKPSKEIPSTIINKSSTKSPGVTSLPSFSMDVDSTQEPDPIGQDVDSSIGNIVSSISFKQTDSEEEKSMGNKQFSAFTIEADDDEEEIEINSGQFNNEPTLVRSGTTTQRKIPNELEVSPNDEAVTRFSSGMELDDDLSPLSTTDSSLAFGSKDPILNFSDPISSTRSPRSSKPITNGDRKATENSSIDTFDLPTTLRNANVIENDERSVVDHLLAIQNECVRIEKSSSKRNRPMDEEADKMENFPTFDLNDLAKSPPYPGYTDEIFFPTD